MVRRSRSGPLCHAVAASIRCRSIQGHGSHSGFQISAVTDMVMVLAASVRAGMTHRRRIIGVETAEERSFVQRMNFTVQQLFHNLGQFIRIVLVMNQKHNCQVPSLTTCPFTKQRMIGFRDVGL